MMQMDDVTEKGVGRGAVTARTRAAFLAATSRELLMSLDDTSVIEAIRRRTLLRNGSWCVVDVVELDGTVRRLPVAHPDPAKQSAAQLFADRWVSVVPDLGLEPGRSPNVSTYGTESPAVLRQLGFGCVVVVPLMARTKVLGAITFVAEEGD